MTEQHLVEQPAIDDLPITEEERGQLRALQRSGRRLESQNAVLLQRLQEQYAKLLNRYDAEGAMIAGDVLKDALSVADATTRFAKSIREDENIRTKLARKAVGKKKGSEFADVDLREARALMQALASRFSHEQIVAMMPVTVEQ